MLKHSQILRLLWTAHSDTNEAALKANADISFATKSGHFNLLRTHAQGSPGTNFGQNPTASHGEWDPAFDSPVVSGASGDTSKPVGTNSNVFTTS